jgi:hypothetical protein
LSNIVKEIYLRNYGSETFYRRNYCDNLVYTEGIMDFQKTLNAYWVVYVIISILAKVIKNYNETDDGFYVVTIKVRENDKSTLKIYREGYVDGIYNECIEVIKLTYLNTNLPVFDYKFYLILSNLEPITFTLLLTSEY